jgi:hypothetical protein
MGTGSEGCPRWRGECPLLGRQAVSWLHGTMAALAGVLGLFIAANHPLWPNLLGVAFVAWAMRSACARRSSCSSSRHCCRSPVSLRGPAGSASRNSTCWQLAAVSGRRCPRPSPASPAGARTAARLLKDILPLTCRPGGGSEHACFRLAELGWRALSVSYAVALLRGLSDADPSLAGWFQGYEEPLNSLRVGKSFLFCLAPLAVTAPAAGTRAGAWRRPASPRAWRPDWAWSVAIIWERSAYPGLFDFSTPYRSTALFWEMHVGGAALDGYLALAVPFAVHAVLRAPIVGAGASPRLLAVLVGYACLTSFSRASISASGFPWRCWPGGCRRRGSRRRRACWPARRRFSPLPPPEPWRVWGGRVLLRYWPLRWSRCFGFGDFMSRRLSASERDLGGRLQHWSAGLGLLRSPSEILLRQGPGTFSRQLFTAVPERAIPGRLRVIDEREAGPTCSFPLRRKRASAGRFELLQRVSPLHDGSYTLMPWTCVRRRTPG